MDELEIELSLALTHLGLNAEVVTIVAEDFGSITKLATSTDAGLQENVKAIAKFGNDTAGIRIPGCLLNDLLVLRQWYFQRKAQGLDTSAHLFTDENINDRMLILKSIDDRKTRKNNAVTLPLLKPENWLKWKALFLTFCSETLGYLGIGVDYVLRTNMTPEEIDLAALPDFDVGDYPDYLYKTVTLGGTHYREDNATVMSHIHAATYGQQSWPLLTKYVAKKDGRGAFLCLVATYEGVEQKNRQINALHAELDNLRYYKHTQKKPISLVFTTIVGIFDELEMLKEPLSDRQKQNHILNIICDPALEAVQTQVGMGLGPPIWTVAQLRDAYCNLVSQQLSAKAAARKVSRVDSTKSRGNQGKAGGGKGGGKGKQSGKGRGRDSLFKDRPVAKLGLAEDGKTELKVPFSYPPDVFRRLTVGDKKKLKEARLKLKRKVSQVYANIQGTDAQDESESDDPNSGPQLHHAGRQFGSRS
jgi:hypothetical protein